MAKTRDSNRPRRDRVFLKHTYTTRLGAGQAHIRYIAFRSRELEDQQRGAFSRDRDHANIAQFGQRLDDRLTRHPKAAKVHKLVFSLRQDQWRAAGWTSYKSVVREALANWEKATGKRLDWVGADHLAQGHPHCHVAIKATYTDQAGKAHRLRLEMQDVKAIRAEFQRVYERDRYLHRSVEEELKREEQRLEQPALGRLAGDLLRRLARAAEQEHRRQELERQRRLGER